MCACLSGHKAQLLVVYMSHPQKTTSHLRGQVPRLPSLSHAGAYARSTSKPCSAFSLRLFTRGAPARWLVCKWGWECQVGTPARSRSPPGTQDRALRRQETQMRPTAVCGDRPPAAARPVGRPRPREPALAPGESERLAETRVAELRVADWARESTECSSSTRAFGRC